MGATALGVLLLIAPGILGGAPGGAPATAPAGASGVSGTPCTGSHIATHFAGTLSAYHPYGAVPSVAGVNVTLQYVYQQNDSSPLGHTVACLPENVSAGTSPNGTFTLRPTVPAGNCSGVKSCIVNSGPFGPFAFRLNRSDPPGDFLRLSWAVGRVQLVWTSALAAVAVDPAGPVATSTGDPLGLTAKALAGDGGPSPANLTHAWTVSGAAWTLLGNRTGPTARVEANGSGGSGAAKVEVRGTYNGTALGPLDAVVDLSAIPTTMVTGTPSPSSVDVGQRLPVEVVADGSAGFSYGAQATPGLGERAQTLNCTTVPGSSADVVVDCKGGLVYDRAGLADPRVNVSNGFSSANWTLGNLTVAPSPAFAVDPDPAEAYPNVTIPFDLDLTAATGSAPFGPACLASGTGAIRCDPSGGPSWRIGFAYPAPGHYVATASVVDATGANETRTVPVTVADPPELGAIVAPGGPVYVGAPVSLTDEVAGGLWPGTYFWNDSDPSATLAHGPLDAAGDVPLTFTPGASGVHQISLVVVDALGSRVAATVALAVGAGVPVRWDVLPGGRAVQIVAGESANLTLRAVDAYGNAVLGYDPTVLVSAAGPGPATALEIAVPDGAGPAGAPTGWTVAAAAWGADGRLNLSVGSQRAGTWFLNLSPAEGPPAGPVGISLTVRADAVAPQLRDPSDAREGPRSGSTLYRIVDPYGNPIPEGFVVVRSAFPSGVLTVDEPIRDGSVWVNYTAIGSSAGTVVVLSEYGVALLPTILVPAVAVATLAWDGPAILTGAAVVTAVAVVLAVRGRHRGPPAPPGNDAELERHAAGRDHLLRKLAEGPCDAFPALASGWTGPPPRPERHELVEWLEALIADGLVVAQIGPAGRPEFLRADAGEVRSDLVLDDAALERALSRRDVPDDAGIRASPDTGEDVDGSAPPPGP